MKRIDLETNVLEAAKQRIEWAFEEFERLYISFSGGKDSTVMLHLVCEQARLLDRKVGLFFLDWEAQFTDTITHLEACINEYSDVLEPYWICLPVMTDNACSMFEPTWTCWDEQKQKLWVRDKPKQAISKKNFFPFYYDSITFEEFAPLFAKCIQGVKSAETLLASVRKKALTVLGQLPIQKRNWLTASPILPRS